MTIIITLIERVLREVIFIYYKMFLSYIVRQAPVKEWGLIWLRYARALW